MARRPNNDTPIRVWGRLAGFGRRVQIGAHHPHLVVFFVEIMEHDIAQRDYPFEFSPVTNRQVAEAVAFHQRHACFEIVVGRDREWISGHNFADLRTGSILALGDHSTHQIALGKDSHQLPVFEDWHRSDVVLHHELRNFEDGVVDFGGHHDLISQQIRDQHLHSLGNALKRFGQANVIR